MTQQTHTILLLESSEKLQNFLADNLTHDGYNVYTADSIRRAKRLLRNCVPDFFLIDLELSDGSGLDFLDELRLGTFEKATVDTTTPAVILAPTNDELVCLRAFEHGSDDYIVIPFRYAELRARIQAILRRTQHWQGQILRVGSLSVNKTARTVEVDGRQVSLSQKEYALLSILVNEPQRVFTKAELLREVWGYRNPGVTRTLDSHACRLRRKLSSNGNAFVVTVWGVGYSLVGHSIGGPGTSGQIMHHCEGRPLTVRRKTYRPLAPLSNSILQV